MLRRKRQIRAQVHRVIDLCLFGVAFWLAHWIRANWLPIEIFGGNHQIGPFSEYLWLLLFVVPAPIFLDLQGFYVRPLLTSRKRTLRQVGQACVLAVLVVISVVFLTRAEPPARSVVILFGGTSFILILLKEELVRRWLESNLGQAQLKKRLILVGTEGDTVRLQAELRVMPDIEVCASLDLNESTVERLVELLHTHSANGVVVSAKHTYFGQIEKAVQACELEGVEAWLIADFLKTHLSRTGVDEFCGRPMLVFRSVPEESWQNLAKQAIDVFGALLLLLLLGIPLLAVAILIKLTSPGPVLFRQQRSGLNGQPFTMLKFRSMVTNAEQRKAELATFNEMTGPVFKMTNDPRITPIGRALRRYSIDEFPQLINVLRGEMSLVGPRPLPVDEVKRFDNLSHRRRLSVKPGLTCLWQVSGRNQVRDFKEWVRLDLEYIDNWSLWLDLKILFRTIPVIVTGAGAK